MKFSTTMLVPALALLGLCQAKTELVTTVNATENAVANALKGPNSVMDPSIRAACTQPAFAVTSGWWHNTWNDGRYYCTYKSDSRQWSMLRAYRSGGQEGTHWTYVDSGDQSRCMTQWGYYSADGKTLNAIIARATMMGDNRLWCALPVYRSGGVQGKQWQYCNC